MSTFIEKLLERIEKEEKISLENVIYYRKVNCEYASSNSIGEVFAFSLVKDIITELLKDKTPEQDLVDLNHICINSALNIYSADAEENKNQERIQINKESNNIIDAVKTYTNKLNSY